MIRSELISKGILEPAFSQCQVYMQPNILQKAQINQNQLNKILYQNQQINNENKSYTELQTAQWAGNGPSTTFLNTKNFQ